MCFEKIILPAAWRVDGRGKEISEGAGGRLRRPSGEEITVTGNRWGGGRRRGVGCILEIEPGTRSEDCR